MSAERQALQAALDYSIQLENRIKELEAGIEKLYRERDGLQRQVNKVRNTVNSDRPREGDPMGPQCEASMPEDFQNTKQTAFTGVRCCKNCGAPQL